MKQTFVFRSSRIIGTDTVLWDVLEPSSAERDHSTITHIDGVRYGKVQTRRLPAHINKIPGYGTPTRELREQRVRAYHKRIRLLAAGALARHLGVHLSLAKILLD